MYNFLFNNVKMLNFSQSISSSFKCNKQKSTVPLPLSFKIPQPKCNKQSRQMTTQESINVNSDTGNSIFHKNSSKSYSKERLEDQYISFKLKPANQQDKQNPVRISKEKPCMMPNRQASNFYFAPFDESIEHHKKNSMSELSKSPEFFCKPNSDDSIKQSYESYKQKQAREQHMKKPYYDENSFCKLMNESEQFQALKRYQYPVKQNQKQTNRKQMKIQIDFEDSVIYDNFQNFQIYTPYKELKDEFERQEKIYEKEMRIIPLQQFDSFSQKHTDPFKNISGNFKNDDTYLEARERKLANIMVDELRAKQKKPTNESTEKKSFFFLTNPTIYSGKKHPNYPKPTQYYQQRPAKKENLQKNVQEFCFSLSSIKLPNENSIQQSCNQQNLFSNSNDQLLFFQSKNGSKNFGSFGGSKKIHIRQLVEEFVDQLENLDQKSLNQKNVHELQGILESIVFKESKARRQPIMIQEDPVSARPRQRSPMIEQQTKKWHKMKRQNSSDIATERKALSEFQNFEHKMVSQKKQSQYAFTINSSQKKLSDRKYAKSPDQRSMSPAGKENIKNQSVYKPNFAMYKSREKLSQEKENQRTCTAFTNMKQKQQILPLNINSKSSVYVKKGAKSNRQHLRTESSHHPTRWRVY